MGEVVKIAVRVVTSGIQDAVGPEGYPSQICKGPPHNFSFM